MKNLYNFIIIVIFITLYVICNLSNSTKSIRYIDNEVCEMNDYEEVKKITMQELLKMNSRIESNNKWDVANKYGYLGKYQIGKSALIDLGYDSAWVEQIRNSIYCISDTILVDDVVKIRNFYYFDLTLFPPKKQEEVIIKLLNKNEKIYLKKHIRKYVGKEIGGIRITKAGILSASFLGFGYVDKYLKSNGKINPADGNGHTIKDRLKHFQNYEVE